MSARQNKKRKGRNNVNNRERTVTTFTEDPNTSFLVPLASEEPAGGAPANLMSSPFSVASSSGGAGNNQGSHFQLAQGNFSMPYTGYMTPLHAQQQQQQQQFYQQPSMLPPGKNDLEVLENLKTMIKEGQHEFYRAIPQPAALAALYMGPHQHHHGGQVPPHPEQIPADYRGAHYSQPGYDSSNDARNLNDKATLDNGSQSMNNNNNEASTSLLGGSKHDTAGPDPRNLSDLKPPANQGDLLDKPRNAGDTSTSDSKTDQPRSAAEYGSRQDPSLSSSLSSPNKLSASAYDSVKDSDASRLPPSRENSWTHRDPLDDRRGRSDDRNGTLPLAGRPSTFDNRPTNGNGGGAGGPDSRFPPPGDRRFFDRDRERDRERFGDRERERDRDWERDRPDVPPIRDIRDRDRDASRDARDTNRRPEFFGRSYGRSHAPRPPPEQRHYEPSYGADYTPPRRLDTDGDRRGGVRPGSLDDRSSRPPPAADDRRPLDDRRPPPLGADDRRGTIDDRPIRPLPGGPVSRPPPPSSEDRASRAPPLSSDDSVAVTRAGTGADDDRGARVPPPSSASLAADERPARVPVSLEERISQPAPSLQDRLSQPGPTAVPTRVDVGRQPSLEERLSHGPVSAAATVTGGGPTSTPSDRPTLSDSSSRTGPLDPPRPSTLNDRSPVNERFARPVTPPPPARGAYTRASSVVRDDLRGPPPKDDVRDRDRERDFRTNSRDLSRERAPPLPATGGPPPLTSSSYRPPSDLDRSFGDRDDRDRRERDAMDLDAPPSRFVASDSLSRPGPPPRRYSPPPLDRDRERDRGRAYYPPRSPPPVRVGEGAYDPNRYAGDRDRERERDAYEQRRRDWYAPGAADDDKRGPLPPPPSSLPPPSWRPYDRPPLSDRDRFDRDRDTRDVRDRDRDLPPRSTWDDRDRRPGFPPSPTRMDSGPPRSLSSRLTDGYGTVGDDRSYPPPPPRDFERPRYGAVDDNPPPFSRVRGRSPSPPPRRGGIDDLRPPMKRAREDGMPPPYGSGTGSGPGPASRDGYSPARRGSIAGEYPPRSVGTPPPSSGGSSSFYDSRGGPPPPPPFSGGSGGDRDYGGGARGVDYGYDRDGRRSPPGSRIGPPGYGRGPYGRPGDVRDDRRYMPPPPPRP
ncbi:hypothetical protein HYDPIDRAFT_43625 [Hydnomerulius pinastri MD-312]|uniref:Unplaced genomic scaffold scaffold_43, whole genome shotgun sequence n=1 Tax=Hydnomerulius pinastri MD-312 TaxID=994086 RepID=A0A0C9W9R0_9AGAM|nr:hypothetical protein HYDPIDRAFT_43625 [Hydnomerulius pinastri MD-312]